MLNEEGTGRAGTFGDTGDDVRHVVHKGKWGEGKSEQERRKRDEMLTDINDLGQLIKQDIRRSTSLLRFLLGRMRTVRDDVLTTSKR